MNLKILQLNIYKGFLAGPLLEYIKSGNFDVLTLQEVTGADASFNNIDCFELIKNLGYQGQLIKTFQTPSGGYFGQATFHKNNFKLIKQNQIWLKPFSIIDLSIDRDFQDDPKGVLHTRYLIDKKHTINILNAHLAWSKSVNDTEEKLRQGRIFIDYIKSLSSPFIICGDFNVDMNSKIIKELNNLAINLNEIYHTTNTINLSNHKAKEELRNGLVVDYIFTSNEVRTLSYEVIDKDLSDHLAIKADLSI